MELLNTVLSAAALSVSATTAWLTLFRRGRVQMTQPTVIFFGLDGGRPPHRGPKAKVFLRTLLFSPAKRGSLVESMYITLQRESVSQSFNVWVYGDGERLSRGSGLFIPETGIATNHHFLLPENIARFDFVVGDYLLRVFAKTVGERTPRLMFSQTLAVTPEIEEGLAEFAGVYFDWSADVAAYTPHLEHPLPGIGSLDRPMA